MAREVMAPLHLFAKVESEIAKFGIAPPVPWPWAIYSDGTTDITIRTHQLMEFLDDLKKAKPEEIVAIGHKTHEQWEKRNEERRKENKRRKRKVETGE